MHHSEHAFHNVTRVEAQETTRLFQSNGSAFSTRRIIIHDNGGISEIALFANHEEALALRQPERHVEAMLKDLSVEQLDDLANAVRAERQSRDTANHPEGCSCGAPDCPQWQADQLGTPAADDAVPAGVSVAEHLAARYAEIDRHPREPTQECLDGTRRVMSSHDWEAVPVSEPAVLPRDCSGGPATVTDDDGLPF